MTLAKPAIADMRFAVDTLNADAANITAPSSGQRDTGWLLNQVPPSSFFNYFANRAYRWMLFLDEVFKTAGIAAGDIKLTGAANITGVVTAGSGLVVSAGGAAVTGNSSVVGTLSVSALAVGGNTTLTGTLAGNAGTLAVSGNETVSGTLGVTGATTFTGVVTTGTDAAIAGNVTAGGQLMAFTDFTFVVADLTLNTFTAVAHPLHTGTGPIRGSNSGGALPAGFPAATDVFAIRVDANTFQIATSIANAIAGTAIDITTNGTGTQTINHQPTTTRIADVTVTRNLVISSGDVVISGTSSYRHGTRTLTIDSSLAVPVVGAVTFDNTSVSFSGAGGQIKIAITLPSRKTLSEVRLYVKDNSSGPSLVTALVQSLLIHAGAFSNIATSTPSSGAGSASVQTLIMTGLSSLVPVPTFAPNKTFNIFATITSGSALCSVLGCEVDYFE